MFTHFLFRFLQVGVPRCPTNSIIQRRPCFAKKKKCAGRKCREREKHLIEEAGARALTSSLRTHFLTWLTQDSMICETLRIRMCRLVFRYPVSLVSAGFNDSCLNTAKKVGAAKFRPVTATPSVKRGRIRKRMFILGEDKNTLLMRDVRREISLTEPPCYHPLYALNTTKSCGFSRLKQ